jgi:hypothetical protein
MREKQFNVTSSQSLTKADSGKIILIEGTSGKTVTLPTAEVGTSFKFLIKNTPASGQLHAIRCTPTDTFNGSFIVNGAKVGIATGGNDSVNFTETAEKGDFIDCYFDGSVWQVFGVGQAASSLTATEI